MQFSDTTNLNGIVQHCETLSGLGNAGISANATILKQFTNYINSAYYEVWMAILSVDKRAKADDYNYTDFSDAPITLVLNQADYTLPVAVTGGNVATFLRCNSVYFLKEGERIHLSLMEDGDTVSTTSGVPTKYRINGKSVILDRPVDSSAISLYTNLHIEFQRVPDAFTSADETQQPGFLATYHDLLPLKASAIYLLPTNPNLASQYEQRFLARLELLKRDTANMIDDASNQMTFINVGSGR